MVATIASGQQVAQMGKMDKVARIDRGKSTQADLQ